MLPNHRFGRYEVRPAERALLIDGKPVELGTRAFDVLQALITHHDRVVTKDELLDAAWPGLIVEENNLQVQVSTLRKLLGAQAIATIPGRGYQFTLAEDVLAEHATKPASAAPALPRPARLTNLHPPRTPLMWRQQGSADIRRLLDQSRLVTLTGACGIGKTRLAVQTGYDLLDTMPDGVWFVGFAALEDPARVAASMLHGLGGMGAGARPGQAPLAALTEFLGNKHALLILDHCNRVAPAVAELCATLRPACPGLRILCTAQEPLGVVGEEAYLMPAPAESERGALAEIHAAQPFTATTAFATTDVAHVANGWFMKWRESLSSHRLAVAIAALASIGLLLAAMAGFWSSRPVQKDAITAQAAPTAMANAGGLSIVVLPFANLTGDAGQEYVADGITASVTADLSRIRDLFVVNATTAFGYKGKTMMPQMAGRDFGVRFMLVGNVQRSGDKIRVNAQLADAISGAQLWSETFESDQADLFRLQDKVTTRIGNSIGNEIVVRTARENETRKSNPTVAELMLRARAMVLKPQSVKSFKEIETIYRKVLDQEPNNVLAISGLAWSLAIPAINFGSGMDQIVREKMYVESRDLALRAKAINPNLPRIYLVLAIFAKTHNDFEGARQNYEIAHSIAPKDPGYHNTLAVSHLAFAEPKQAIELFTEAINLDPRHVYDVILGNMAYAHFMLGDNDAAILWAQKSITANPELGGAYRFLAMAYALKGDDAKARAAATEFREFQRRTQLPENFDKPFIPPAGAPAAYLEWFEAKYLPAARKAGLIE